MRVSLGNSLNIDRIWHKADPPRTVPCGRLDTYAKVEKHSCDASLGSERRPGEDIRFPLGVPPMSEKCFSFSRMRWRVECHSFKMRDAFDDEWLGALHQFPTILHARASFSFDVTQDSLQKALVSALASLGEVSLPKMITVADRVGYSGGKIGFKIGIGNGEAFDVLDAREEERILDRIENRGAFGALDLAFHLHYTIDDGRRHKLHEDHYLVRLVFQLGRVEVLVHHLKGIKRVEPVELVRLILERLNIELANKRFPQADLESVSSS